MFKYFFVLLFAFVIGNLISGIITFVAINQIKQMFSGTFEEDINKKPKYYYNPYTNAELKRRIDVAMSEINRIDMVLIDQKKLIDQLYSDRDDDINKIADQINRLETLVQQLYSDHEDDINRVEI